MEGAPSHSSGWLILAGGVVLAMALACGIYAAAWRIDVNSTAREERLVANGVQLHEAELRRSLQANTIWDDAVAHLDARFDSAWARDFIGQYFWRTNGAQLVYVIDRNGGPIFAYERGRAADPGSFAPLARAVAPMVAQMRARERARGLFHPEQTIPSSPIEASTVARRGNEAFILAASLVQSDHSSGIRPSERAPIVVVGQAVDGAFVAKIAGRYLLNGLHVETEADRPPNGYAEAPLADAASKQVVRLAWRPSSPIFRLVGIAVAPVALAFLTLGLIATILLRQEWLRNRALTAAMQEARAASKAKSAFLATMSHEIRTPLNGVLGMTQVMAMEPLSGVQRERLDVVRRSGEALLAILNDVLDISKIEAGKLELESTDFDLAELLQGAHAAFTDLAEKKGLSFTLDIVDAEGTYRGDPTRIRQILYNLIANALKFTTQGHIGVRAEPFDGGLMLSVSDTGEGIASEKLPLLFDKFTQADASTTRRFGGTGLGLSICRELAALMGGAIEVQSTPGAGSTFTATLKLTRVGDPRPEGALPSPRTAPPMRDREGLRVLVAEDNPVNQLVIRTLLQQAGIDSTMVDNGALAVEAWARGHWDVILMDVQMPVMDGIDAARLIRSREVESGRPRTPIIALTANAMAHQVDDYAAASMDGHVAKPIDARALFEALARFAPTEGDDLAPWNAAPKLANAV